MPLYNPAVPDDAFTPADFGFLAWNYDVGTAASNSGPTTNVINLIRVNVRQAISVTNVVLAIATAGSGLTSGQNFAGLYAGQTAGPYTAGQLIGTSVDQTAAWGSAGLKTVALASGPFAIPANTFVWVGIVSNTGTSTPAFYRVVNSTASALNGGLAVAASRWATNGTATTALPASVTPASNTQVGIGFWAGLS